jgi:hypothetical protein
MRFTKLKRIVRNNIAIQHAIMIVVIIFVSISVSTIMTIVLDYIDRHYF